MAIAPLVSILIPCYNSKFFEAALQSAIAQNYPNTEIIVADDSDDGQAEMTCQKYAHARLRYVKNAIRRGFHGNFAYCFEQASGEFIKFLNHDDLLHPDCVSTMVKSFEVGGAEIKLVTSRRLIINDQGRLMEDLKPTVPLSSQDCVLVGRNLGNHVLTTSLNVIGEPTTVMFRKSAVSVNGGTLFKIDHREYLCLADVSLWLRLLADGKAVYIARPLSRFRLHQQQLQTSPAGAAQCMVERLYLPHDARTLGFLEDEASFRSAVELAVKLIKSYQSKPGNSDEATAIYAAALGDFDYH